MTNEEQTHLQKVAADIALAEMLRILIGECLYSPERDEFRRKLSLFEQLAVDGLNGRSLFPPGAQEAEHYVKDAASAWISRLVASILHPDDRPAGKSP